MLTSKRVDEKTSLMSLQVSKTPPDISLCERQYYFPHTSLYVLSTVSLSSGECQEGSSSICQAFSCCFFISFSSFCAFTFTFIGSKPSPNTPCTLLWLTKALGSIDFMTRKISFPFLCHEADHLYRVAGIPSVTVEYCHCVLGLLCYGVGNLLVFL